MQTNWSGTHLPVYYFQKCLNDGQFYFRKDILDFNIASNRSKENVASVKFWVFNTFSINNCLLAFKLVFV